MRMSPSPGCRRPVHFWSRTLRSWSCAILLFAAGACGGDKATGPGAESPAASGEAAAAGPAPGAVPGGQQIGVEDSFSSGGGAPRPQMNAAAAEAYAAGMQAFVAGDLAGAKEQFTRATDADAQAYKAFYSLGVVQERLGQRAAALSAYRSAAAVVPDYEPALVSYALLMARGGQAQQAEQFLGGQLAKLPKSAALSAGLAEVKSIQGDSATAQRIAREALKKNPDYRPAMVTIARDHYRNRRLDLALYTLKGILDGYGTENPPRDKDNADARLLRGLIYREQNARKPALEEFRRAVKLRPDLVEARVQLGAYELEAGNAAEAAQLLEGALRYDRDNVIARLNLGDAYRLLGRPGDARRELEWVARLDPALPQPHYDLGLLYLFSESIPGLAPKQAVDLAIAEFEKYKELRSRAPGSGPDDTEELITRAKSKRALIEAKEAEQAGAKGAAASSGVMP